MQEKKYKRKVKAHAKRYAAMIDKLSKQLTEYDNDEIWECLDGDFDVLLLPSSLVTSARDILDIASERLHEIAGTKREVKY